MLEALTKMHDTEAWTDALEKNGWADAFITGPQFETFLREQDQRVGSTLTELGLR